MSLDTYPPFGTASSRSHPYAPSLSSSASSSTSSVFSDAASQTSSSTSASTHSAVNTWEEDWSSRVHPVVSGGSTNSANLSAFAPITRVSTFPQYHPSACRETAVERVLPPLRTDLAAPAEQRLHPRRSSTAINHRQPPQLVRQSDRKVNFVDCLVG
jgi:hypothetical protein